MAAPGDASGGPHRSGEVQLGRAVVLVAAALVVGLLVLHRASGVSSTVVTAGATTTVKGAASAPPTVIVNTTTTAALRSPQDIKVLVANGTGLSGAASQFSNRLHSSGYNTLASTNTTAPAAGSAVFYAPSFDREAAEVATLLGLSPSTVQPLPQQSPVPQLHDAQILVIVGPDLAGQGTGTSSTTTSSGGTTSTRRVGTTVGSTTAGSTTTARPAATTTSRPGAATTSRP